MKFDKILSFITAGALLSACAGCSSKKNAESSEVDPLAPKAAPQSITFDWQEPFETILIAFKNSDRYTDTSMFEIRDLTGDETPELIISPSDDVAAKCEVYKLIGTRADLITNSGSYGTIDYIPEMNAIGFLYEGTGFKMGEYQTYQDGSFVTDVNFYTNADSASSGAVIRYEVNGEDVTLTKFQEALLPYQDSFTVKVGRKFSLGTDAVNYAIRRSKCWTQVLTDDQKQLYKDKLNEILSSQELKDAAFEIVDLDLNELPEVVVSTGLLNDSETRILYLDTEGVKELSVTSDADGGIQFDVSSKIFYAADYYGSIQCWSMAGADISSFQPSDSTVRCGREYDLTAENIENAFLS